MLRRILALAALVLGVLLVAAWLSLVPGEAERPPSEGIARPVLERIETPFAHRWARESSHPLLAAAAIDIDGDGRDEVFLGGSDGQHDALLAWRGGVLANIARAAGIGDEEATYGALSLDMDRDGDVDLIAAGAAGLTLWLNDGGRFDPRQLDVAIPADAVPMAVTAADYDRDGDPDLYVSMFVTARAFRSPVFNDPAHAKRNLLLRNDGGLAFTDVTGDVAAGLQNTFTASFADLDRDGWPDLVLAQNTGEVEILRNLGNGTFERAAFRSGYGFWMGLAFGDIDHDGDADIFLSNIGNSVPALLVRGDRRDDQRPENEWLLLRNDGGFKFTAITGDAGLTGFGFAWGGAFTDINLDGATDLLVAQNYVKWPVHGLFRLPGKLLLGDPGKAVRFYTSGAAPNSGYGHVPLIADLDGDGRNDVLWVNMDGHAHGFLNRTQGRFLSVRLPDAPASIGARIRLEGVSAPVHTLIAGEGLTSDFTTQATFGLPGGGPPPAALVVEWPDGRTTRIADPALNETIRIKAP